MPWDGRDDDGDPVPPGTTGSIVLPGQDRDMVFPLRILVRQPGGGDSGSVSGGETSNASRVGPAVGRSVRPSE